MFRTFTSFFAVKVRTTPDSSLYNLVNCRENVHNGKVELSHLTDKQKFYRLLTYTDDRELGHKLSEWEAFYNLRRPHGALKGEIAYEALKMKLAA